MAGASRNDHGLSHGTQVGSVRLTSQSEPSDDALRAAIRKVDEACPCRDPHCSITNGCGGFCSCTIGNEQGGKCEWPGHAAVREAMRVAAEWGNENGIFTTGRMNQELDSILGERKEAK